MKVVLVISSLSGGGAERVTCNLANYLNRHGNEVSVITLSNVNDTYVLDEGVCRICLLDNSERSNKLHNLYIEQKRLKQYMKENRDVSCYVAMLPVCSFLTTKFRRFSNAKIIVSERVYPAHYSFINGFLMRRAIKRCDGLVVQTKEIADWYKDVENKIVIPNAINEGAVFSSCKNIEKKIVAVGRLTKQKNYPMILDAFRIFSEKHPDYILEIYGQGALEEELKEKAKQYGIGKKVEFRGYVKNVSEKISTAACFVMASNYEGVSNALIEAMCMGIPCVATDCDGGGARSLIKNNKNGILLNKEDVDGMVDGMLRIVEDKVFCKKISDEAMKLREDLNPEKIYGRWAEYIEKAVK